MYCKSKYTVGQRHSAQFVALLSAILCISVVMQDSRTEYFTANLLTRRSANNLNSINFIYFVLVLFVTLVLSCCMF